MENTITNFFKKALLAISMLFLSLSSFAQNASVDQNLLSTTKEVFIKGSIDGKSLFMVYGFGEMTGDMKDFARNMSAPINMEDLVDIKDSVVDYGDAVRNGADWAQDSSRFARDGVENIAKLPWGSLNKIPGSYKVSFENARDSYYHADNVVSGTVKYAGHAIWANVKGAYYLVVEAPVAMVVGLGQTVVGAAGTVLSVPLAIVGQTLAVTFRLAGKTLKIAGTLIKDAAIAVSIAAAGTYSLVSSSIASGVTLIAAGGVAVFKGGKWLVVDLPKKMFTAAKVKVGTEINLDDQKAYGLKALETLQNSGLVSNIESATGKVKDYTSKIIVNLRVGSKVVKSFVIKMGIKDKLVLMTGVATSKYLNALAKLPENANKTKNELKAQISLELKALLGDLALI